MNTDFHVNIIYKLIIIQKQLFLLHKISELWENLEFNMNFKLCKPLLIYKSFLVIRIVDGNVQLFMNCENIKWPDGIKRMECLYLNKMIIIYL